MGVSAYLSPDTEWDVWDSCDSRDQLQDVDDRIRRYADTPYVLY
jgi:hypothetical protein